MISAYFNVVEPNESVVPIDERGKVVSIISISTFPIVPFMYGRIGL
ncbi:hypothetical protein [Peribacillus frigoritolerans]|nr:hypothetical protein [Peribacillus castrilensis]